MVVDGTVQDMTDGHPLFAFAFRSGRRRPLHDLEEFDVVTNDVDFVWVHLDLRDAAAQAWLRGRPWPPGVIETVVAPIQRGRLFIKPDMIYGHLRDFRDEPIGVTLQAGSLCVVISQRSIVTGRRLPLRSMAEVLRRLDAGTALPTSPFGLITEFLKALNDIGEGLLQEASERLSVIGSKVLRRQGAQHRDDILEIRRDSIQVARDIALVREWTAIRAFILVPPVTSSEQRLAYPNSSFD